MTLLRRNHGFTRRVPLGCIPSRSVPKVIDPIMLQNQQWFVAIFIIACCVPALNAECGALVVNSFSNGETTSRNALGQLSSDDGSTQGVNIVGNRLIIQTKPNVAGSWFTDVDSGCKNLSASNYDQVEVEWSNSSPSTLIISVLWGVDDNACQTRSWKETSSSADSGVIGDTSKTSTFPLTPEMIARLHTIYLVLPAQETSTTYSIRSIRLVQTGSCAVATAKSARSSNTALSLSLAFVLGLVTFTFTGMAFFIN